VIGVDAVGLVVALSVSVVLLGLLLCGVWWLDRYDRDPLHLVLVAFLWGGFVAPLAALGVERVASSEAMVWSVGTLGSAALTPLIEEAFKAAGVVLVVVLNRGLDAPSDGVVYGSAAGLGFAVGEILLRALPGLAVDVEAVAFGPTVAGTLYSTGVHAATAAMAGACVGYAVLSRGLTGRVTWVTLGVGLASLVRGACIRLGDRLGMWNGAASPSTVTLLIALAYLLYLATLAGVVLSEHRILKRQLEEEVGYGVLPGWVADVIPFYRRRVRSDWWQLRHERTVIARKLSRLAFRKHSLRHLPQAEKELAGLEVVQLRQHLRRILRCGDEEG